MSKKIIIITGIAGFIFSNFIRKFADNNNYKFIGIDKIYDNYNLKNIYEHKNHKFYLGDIADSEFMENVFKLEKPNYVINGAAQSFVDASIASAIPFIHSNILGAQVMIDLSIKYKVEKFLQISTDECYGQLTSPNDDSWTEDRCISPRNPYSATKGAAELLVKAAIQTHKLPGIITRCSNNYGKFQPVRNLIPIIINAIMRGKEIPIHGTGENIREWIHVNDHNDAVIDILEKGSIGEIYNIGSGVEKTNLETVKCISSIMNVDPYIKFITDRKGHDYRYSVDCSKIKKLGWQPKISFEDGMKSTITWYQANPDFYL